MQSIARPDFTPGHICWGYGDGLQSIRGARDTRVTNAYSSPSFSRIYFTTFSLPWTPGTFCFLLSRHSCGRLPAACQKFLSKTTQFNPFDLVVLLSLSNTVQNAIIGDDNSVTGGIVGALSLLAINWLVVRVLFRSPQLTRLLEGHSSVLVRN